jgi:hypothetical protein
MIPQRTIRCHHYSTRGSAALNSQLQSCLNLWVAVLGLPVYLINVRSGVISTRPWPLLLHSLTLLRSLGRKHRASVIPLGRPVFACAHQRADVCSAATAHGARKSSPSYPLDDLSFGAHPHHRHLHDIDLQHEPRRARRAAEMPVHDGSLDAKPLPSPDFWDRLFLSTHLVDGTRRWLRVRRPKWMLMGWRQTVMAGTRWLPLP